MKTLDSPGLDETDRRILDRIQSDFPLSGRPYAVIGESLGLGEEEVFSRVRRMRSCGIIRRLGANFQSDKLGFASTLCAAHVPEERKSDFIEKVNALTGVTHNYERDHHYNIWFTLIGESPDKLSAILSQLEKESGIPIMNLPARRIFKIRVDFSMV